MVHRNGQVLVVFVSCKTCFAIGAARRGGQLDCRVLLGVGQPARQAISVLRPAWRIRGARTGEEPRQPGSQVRSVGGWINVIAARTDRHQPANQPIAHYVQRTEALIGVFHQPGADGHVGLVIQYRRQQVVDLLDRVGVVPVDHDVYVSPDAGQHGFHDESLPFAGLDLSRDILVIQSSMLANRLTDEL